MRHTHELCACPAATDDAHMLGWPFRVLCLLSLFCRSPDGRMWAAGVRTQSASTPQVWCRVRRSNLAWRWSCVLRATVSARRGHSANGTDRSPRRLAALTRDCCTAVTVRLGWY